MSARAAGALVSGALLVVAALSVSAPWLFLPGALLLGLVLLGLLSALLGRVTLHFAQNLAAPYTDRGTPARLQLRVTMYALLPVAPLHLVVRLPGGGSEAYTLPARCFGRSVSEIALPCPHCGRFAAGVERVTVSDCFGFFHFSQKCKAQLSLAVLPVPEDAALPEAPEGTRLQRHPLPSAEPEEPDTLRDYREGDDLRRIHWKQSLHRERLTVRTFQPAGQGAWLLVLAGGPCSADTRDALLERAVGLLQDAAARALPLVLSLPGAREIPLGGPDSLLSLRLALAEAELRAAQPLRARLSASLTGVRSYDALCLICPRLNAGDAEALLRLSGRMQLAVICAELPDDAKIAERLKRAGITIVSLHDGPAEAAA